MQWKMQKLNAYEKKNVNWSDNCLQQTFGWSTNLERKFCSRCSCTQIFWLKTEHGEKKKNLNEMPQKFPVTLFHATVATADTSRWCKDYDLGFQQQKKSPKCEMPQLRTVQRVRGGRKSYEAEKTHLWPVESRQSHAITFLETSMPWLIIVKMNQQHHIARTPRHRSLLHHSSSHTFRGKGHLSLFFWRDRTNIQDQVTHQVLEKIFGFAVAVFFPVMWELGTIKVCQQHRCTLVPTSMVNSNSYWMVECQVKSQELQHEIKSPEYRLVKLANGNFWIHVNQ